MTVDQVHKYTKYFVAFRTIYQRIFRRRKSAAQAVLIEPVAYTIYYNG